MSITKAIEIEEARLKREGGVTEHRDRYVATLGEADAYSRGRREAIEEAAEWLVDRARALEDQCDDECDGHDADRFLDLAKSYRETSKAMLAELTAKGPAPSDLPQRPGLEPWVRGPDGKPDNCAIGNGAPESECQMCAGSCPDRAKGPARGQ